MIGILQAAQLRAVFGHELFNLKLTVAFNIHEGSKLVFSALYELLYPLELSAIRSSDRLILIVQVAVHVSLELVELLQLEIVLALVILDLLHQVSLDLKLLGLHLRLEYSYLFILPSHLLLDVAPEAAHLRLDFLDDRAPVDHLGKGVADFALCKDLIVPDLVVAPDHFLGASDYFIFENVKTLLQEVKLAGHS